jgi:hypothetical protein
VAAVAISTRSRKESPTCFSTKMKCDFVLDLSTFMSMFLCTFSRLDIKNDIGITTKYIWSAEAAQRGYEVLLVAGVPAPHCIDLYKCIPRALYDH